MKKSLLSIILLLAINAIQADSIHLTNKTNFTAYFSMSTANDRRYPNGQGPFCVQPGEKVYVDAVTYRGMSAYVVDNTGKRHECYNTIKQDFGRRYDHIVAITPCMSDCDGKMFEIQKIRQTSTPPKMATKECTTGALRGEGPLHTAARRGNFELVKKLLDEGTDPNIKADTHNQGTALMYAAKQGSVPVVALLLDYGADVNAKTNRGRSALYYAALYNKGNVIDLLLERDANPNVIKPTRRMKKLIQQRMKKRAVSEVPQKQNIARRLIAQYKELQVLRAKRKAGNASPEEIARIDQQMSKLKKAAVAAGVAAAFMAGVITGRFIQKSHEPERATELQWSAPSPIYEEKGTQTENTEL